MLYEYNVDRRYVMRATNIFVQYRHETIRGCLEMGGPGDGGENTFRYDIYAHRDLSVDSGG